MNSIRNFTARILLVAALALCAGNPAQAALTSYLVDGPVFITEGPNLYRTVNYTLDIDPANTNWIGWSSYNNYQFYNNEVVIGGAVPQPNIGVDDYIIMTLTNPLSQNSSPYTMDRNDAVGNSYGHQAIIFGDSETAPDVVRANLNGVVTVFDEAGLANGFFNAGGAGSYAFRFDFVNAYTNLRGHNNFYLLVDANEGPNPTPVVPEPATLALAGLGLAGLTWIGRRHRRAVIRAFSLLPIAFGLLAMLAGNPAQAALTSYLVDGPVSITEGPNLYRTVTYTLDIDPANTNWIGWSSYNNYQFYNNNVVIGGAVPQPNIGVDDYIIMTLTNPLSQNSSPYTMDRNDAVGNSYGHQAIIFGDSETAPDVVRANLNGVVTVFDEAGLANGFFNASGAGSYAFRFDFVNAYTNLRGHNNFYLLVDANEGPNPTPVVPEPATLALAGLGLAGLAWMSRRRIQLS